MFGFLLLLAAEVSAQPKNEIPLYGDEPKTAQEQEADRKFIEETTRLAGSARKASEIFSQKGSVAIEAGNAAEAIRRFNQAYLLDASWEGPYWGLAITTARQEQFDLSEKLFRKALELSPKNSRLTSDYGYMLVSRALTMLPKHDEGALSPEVPAILERAKQIYLDAVALDPNESGTYARLAVLEFYGHNYSQAWYRVQQCRDRGGVGLDPRFLRDLSARAPDPSAK